MVVDLQIIKPLKLQGIMKKLRIKDVVKFRRKAEGPRETFIHNLKTANDKQNDGDARNYWVRSESAVKNTFRYDNPEYISDKLNELLLDTAHHSNTIKQYKHNVTILNHFENFDFSVLKPPVGITILPQHNENKILAINGLPIESAPSFVYSFKNDGNDEVGAIWFVAQKDGFKREELGMFADILSRYLKLYFSKKYDINHKYCIVVDLYNGSYIDYLQLEEGAIPKVLNRTLDEIKKIV